MVRTDIVTRPDSFLQDSILGFFNDVFDPWVNNDYDLQILIDQTSIPRFFDQVFNIGKF